MPLKKICFMLAAVIIGCVIGVKSAIWLLKSQINKTSIKNDVWVYNPYVGSEDADGLTRAAVAVIGFLGMTKHESLYFIAKTDIEGQPLSGRCNYKVTGKITEQDARWWSITVYDNDTDKLISNNENRYSYSGDTIKFDDNDHFQFNVSSDKQEGNWLPVKQGAYFDLTLRLYNPNKSIVNQPEHFNLPTVTKESCQ